MKYTTLKRMVPSLNVFFVTSIKQKHDEFVMHKYNRYESAEMNSAFLYEFK